MKSLEAVYYTVIKHSTIWEYEGNVENSRISLVFSNAHRVLSEYYTA